MRDDAIVARRLGHDFANPLLLDQALRHRSARLAGVGDYERLEFLGDALLGFVVADVLTHEHPLAPESELSVMRSHLVRRETLAELGRELALTEHLRLGKGELRAGVAQRDSVLSDAVEALFGAVYLDAGYGSARELILRLLGPRLAQVRVQGGERDAKSRLQEWLQARALSLPTYVTVERAGREPDIVYRVVCRVSAFDVERAAQDRDVRQAEQKAAECMLKFLLETAT